MPPGAERSLTSQEEPPGWNGTGTWSGTLKGTLPGLDLSLAGRAAAAVCAGRGLAGEDDTGSREVRPRVSFKVTATDAVDGPVSAVCVPKSGGRFLIGRTSVRCAAADTSANTATATVHGHGYGPRSAGRRELGRLRRASETDSPIA